MPGTFRSRLALIISLPVAALLAACTSPEARVRAGLVEAGLSEPMAACMAQPLVRDLNQSQLRKLGSLAGTRDVDLRRISLDEFMYRIRALQDPQIIRVTASAALSCSLR